MQRQIDRETYLVVYAEDSHEYAGLAGGDVVDHGHNGLLHNPLVHHPKQPTQTHKPVDDNARPRALQNKRLRESVCR